VSVVTATRPSLASRWRAFEAWVGTRSSAVALLAVALAVYAVQSAVLPAYPGRDMSRYLETFVQLGYHVPMYPAVLNTRGPLAALGVGVPLELGGWAAEVFLAVLYALSIVAWARVALIFGRRAALATSVLLLVYPGYGILFHQLASDSLFAAAFAGWALLLARALQRPSKTVFAVAGVATGVLVLVRPANQVLLVLAALPLLQRGAWRERLAWAAAFFIPAAVVSQSWKAYAEARWGNAVILKPSMGLLALAFVLVPFLLPSPWRTRAALGLAAIAVVGLAVHGWPGQRPGDYVHAVKANESNQFLYRSFELERIMSPDNGPASRRVAAIVRRQLLPFEPYKSYGVTVHEFFASGSDRVFGDLTGTVPADDLAAATREAIRAHPGTFARGIGSTLWDQVARRPVYAPVPSGAESAAPAAAPKSRGLPKPTEGQPIPSSRIGPALYTPGGTAREVWRSPTDHSFVFSNPRDEHRFARFNHDVDRLAGRVPTRDGDAGAVHRLNQASHAFPPLIVWLVIGVIAFVLRRPRHALIALAPAVAASIVIVATALVVPAVAEYSAPVSPAFVVLAAAGVLGAPSAARSRAAAARTTRYVGIAAGAVAGVWAVWIYFDRLHKYVDGAGAQHDLFVFLRGAGDVVHGASPYVYRGDNTFAYPPFAAWLLAPLHPLSSSAAAIVWTLLSLAMVVGALWLLELRDWRCYALAGVFLFTRSSIDLGTIEPLLLLAVAAAWYWRDRAPVTGAAAGVAIVLKLFLWPLAVWLAFTRRVRAALVTVVVAATVALVSWATIGFSGIGDYPHILRRLADDESTSSYSVVALGVRAHLPLLGARIVSVLVTVALLAAAAWVMRDERRTARERDVATLTLCLAAALALSPIVWVHYFLLLLVPLALAQPRLSWLWFVPLAYYPLGEAAWPAGDARKLGLALVASLVLLLAGVVRTQTLRTLRA
jgi:alpha-1,2-mannosyltransferase